MLAWADVAEIGRSDAARTQQMGMSDFEDALQIAATESCRAEVIVTRNTGDFIGKTALRVVVPEDFVDQTPGD